MIMVWVTMFATARAHEIQPTIVDFRTEGQEISLTMRLNAEALLSGINLDGLLDTDEAIENADYDALRDLPEAALASRIPGLLTVWNDLPLIMAGDTPVALRIEEVFVQPQPNIEVPRYSIVEARATVLDGANSVTFGWPEGAGAMVLRQQNVQDPFTGFLEFGARTRAIDLSGGAAAGGWRSFLTYIPVGFDHIVPQGLDHILFVLGLFFLSTRMGPLLWQVTAFTLAHTVTLALGALNIVTVPEHIVEPIIAASIVYVAVENIFFRGFSPWRPMVVFLFGLLHGLGFASVLQEFGLPAGQFIPALIGFNVGVELGQLAVIALAALWIWLAARCAQFADPEYGWYDAIYTPIAISGSVLIGFIGAYWVVERVFL